MDRHPIDAPLLLIDHQLYRLESIVTNFKSELERLNLDPSVEFYGRGHPEETLEFISQFSGCESHEENLDDFIACPRRTPKQKTHQRQESTLGQFLNSLKEKVLMAKGSVEILARKLENQISQCESPREKDILSPTTPRKETRLLGGPKRSRSGSLGLLSTEMSWGEEKKGKNKGKWNEVEAMGRDNWELRREVESLRKEHEDLRERLIQKNKMEDGEKIPENNEELMTGQIQEMAMQVLGFLF